MSLVLVFIQLVKFVNTASIMVHVFIETGMST